MKGTGTKLN